MVFWPRLRLSSWPEPPLTSSTTSDTKLGSDHRLLHGVLGELFEGDLDLAGDGVVSAVTARDCDRTLFSLPL